MRRSFVVLAVFGLVGCGEAPAPLKQAKQADRPAAVAQPTATSNHRVGPQAATKTEVPANAFPDVPTAFNALLAGISANDHQAVFTAETWLAAQKDAAVNPLVTIVRDDNESLERRLGASRALGRIGAPSTQALLDCLIVDAERVRLRTIESLGHVKPTSPQIVDKLLELASGPDETTRGVAIGSLARIGPPAKKAVPQLMEVFNSAQEPETLRAEAQRALKAIDPRRGLMGLTK